MQYVVHPALAERLIRVMGLSPDDFIIEQRVPLMDVPKLAEELSPRNRHERRRDEARKRRMA